MGESDSGTVVRIDPATGTIAGTPVRVGGALLVWTVTRGGEVAAFDAASGRMTLAPSKVRGGADAIAARGRSVWVINRLGITPLLGS